jgi:hypothetical protein
MVCLGALAALPVARASESQRSPALWLVSIAVAALGVGLLLRRTSLVPASLVVVGGVYAAQLAVDDAPLDANAALVAAGLYLTAELAYWSLEERVHVQSEPGETLRRLGLVALLALGALLVAALLLASTDAVRARGLALDVLGALAAAAVLVLVLLTARGGARG